MASPRLRPETPADVTAIHRLTADAFRSAPHTSGTEAFIVEALRNAGVLSLSLVAEEAGVLVGHVGLSPVTVADGSSGWYGLGPVSVRPSHQGRGIGSALVREALARLRAMGASGCVLVGEPAYYGRFGFEADPHLVLPGVPPAYFQALAFNGAVARGEVKFHPGFEATAA